ncbi:hypothetical protein GA0115234_100329 [Streptomyces sp. DvalAA-43]|nr:hypothetical protein GA0115234_100329 [Streptomyces sp. DvalAA-43]
MPSRSTAPQPRSERTRRWPQISASPRNRCGRGCGKDETQAAPEGSVSAAEELARLLKAEQEWQLEREILRRAAAYFARDCVLSTKGR